MCVCVCVCVWVGGITGIYSLQTWFSSKFSIVHPKVCLLLSKFLLFLFICSIAGLEFDLALVLGSVHNSGSLLPLAAKYLKWGWWWKSQTVLWIFSINKETWMLLFHIEILFLICWFKQNILSKFIFL
jgi:hypothetical protein